MLTELLSALDRAKTGTPEQSVESAVMVYLAAQAEADKYTELQAQCKALITEVMTETGKLTYRTACGTVAISSAALSISYSATALDALCASMPELASVLAPHRKQIERPGVMRIKAAK